MSVDVTGYLMTKFVQIDTAYLALYIRNLARCPGNVPTRMMTVIALILRNCI